MQSINQMNSEGKTDPKEAMLRGSRRSRERVLFQLEGTRKPSILFLSEPFKKLLNLYENGWREGFNTLNELEAYSLGAINLYSGLRTKSILFKNLFLGDFTGEDPNEFQTITETVSSSFFRGARLANHITRSSP